MNTTFRYGTFLINCRMVGSYQIYVIVFNSRKVVIYEFNHSQSKIDSSEVNNNIFISITNFQKI